MPSDVERTAMDERATPLGHQPMASSEGEVAAEAREIMYSVQRWVERADLKASILLAAISAALGGTIVSMFNIVEWAARGGFARAVPEILLLIAVICLFGAGFQAGRVIHPRLGEGNTAAAGTAAGDLVFFGRLRSIPPAQIAEDLRKAINEGTLVDQYVEQVRVNAEVAWAKYRVLDHAIAMLLPGASFALLGIGTWMFMRLLD
jgi:hypothetical protein